MNKLNKIAALVALVAVSASASAQAIDNWRGTDGTVWKNGTNELCWRDNFWTPATGVQGCDGVPAPAAPAPASAPVAAPAPAALAPAPAPAVVAPQTEKVSYAADAFFDFDKADWQDDATAFLQTCRRLELDAALERSRSGRGGHVWIFFDQAIPAALAAWVEPSRSASRLYSTPARCEPCKRSAYTRISSGPTDRSPPAC